MKKKTHEEYVKELADKNPTVEVVEEYINTNTKIKHHCLIHDIYWNTQPSRVLRGCGCEMCHSERISLSKTKTHQQYIEDVKSVNPDIEVMEEYIDAKTHIRHHCKKHNIYWDVLPTNILHGYGCPECGKEKIVIKNSKNHEQYVDELKEINPNIVVVGTYIDANTSILHKCLIDKHEWYARPGNILFGKGCPKCSESVGERKISIYLDKYKIHYIRQKKFINCRDINCLPFDFYLPKYNICIEYDGKQHYEPIEHFGGVEAFNLTVKHDKIKNKYCKDNGISLLRIPYYKNVEEELNNFLFI